MTAEAVHQVKDVKFAAPLERPQQGGSLCELAVGWGFVEFVELVEMFVV